MKKETVKTTSTRGIGIIGIAIILMVSGYVLEHQDIYTNYQGLGEILFTIGFWLFVIPFVFIAIILIVFVIFFMLFVN